MPLPLPPKPDRQISRIRLSSRQLPMGWLRSMFQDVWEEPASRAILTDPLTQLRAAHCQSRNVGQAVFRRADANSLSALRRPSRDGLGSSPSTAFLRPFAPRSLLASSLLRTL
jgi:hypothetical protein